MKFGFVTCVQLGLSCMESIYQMGEKLDLAITLPDHINQNKSGRVYIDDFCDGHKIPLFKSTNINNLDVIKAICGAEIDWLFIIGWSQIAKKNLLDSPKKGVLGIHPTLLPEGRGRASIPWAILKELNETGVTMFKMDNGIDTGPIAGQIKILLRYHPTNEADLVLIYFLNDTSTLSTLCSLFLNLIIILCTYNVSYLFKL